MPNEGIKQTTGAFMATDDIHKWADEAVKDVIERCIRSLIANLEREARNLKRRLR